MAVQKFASALQAVDLNEKLQKENEFFSEKFYLSFSGLSRLIHSPALFYNKYILKQKEMEDASTVEGKLIHCLLLQPDKFDDEFLVTDEGTISGKGKQLVDALFEYVTAGTDKEYWKNFDEASLPKMSDFESVILDLTNSLEYFQKMEATARVNKIANDPKLVAYWNNCFQAMRKTIISREMLVNAAGVVQKIQTNPYLRDIMGINTLEMGMNVVAYDEMHLYDELDGEYMFGIHGVIDNLVIDHDQKIIRVNDLKTTSKDISRFKEAIDYFNYDLQLGHYATLILNNPMYKTLMDDQGYTLEVRFIVVDCYAQIATIKLSAETFVAVIERLREKYEQANYHLINRDFTLPYEFVCLENHEMVI